MSKKKGLKSSSKIDKVIKKTANKLLDRDIKRPNQSSIKRIMSATDKEIEVYGNCEHGENMVTCMICNDKTGLLKLLNND